MDEQAFRDEVYGNLRRNFTAHLLHGVFGQTGFRLIQLPTFIPVYLHLLSGSELVVGFARGAQSLGMCITPLLSATLVEHRVRLLPLGMWVGSLMRLQLLGLALAGFLLVDDQHKLIATCAFLGFFGVFMGMQGVIFNTLMSKVIPVEVRGRLSGLRNAFAGLTAAGVAYLGGEYLVETNALGNGFATTFLFAFALTALGLSMLLAMREPASPDVRERTKLLERLGDIAPLLRGDRNFAWYLLARALATLGRMAVPFYFLYATRELGPSALAQLGIVSAAFQLSQTTTNLVWGFVADRFGFRWVFLASLVTWIASVLALQDPRLLPFLALIFVGLGAGVGGFQMGAQNLVLEFGERQDLPLRIALSNSTSELMGAVGPVLGGVLIAVTSYELLFTLAIGCKLLALALLVIAVRDPRYASPV